MNRYQILIGKDDPPTNSKTYLAGLDIGKGDSTSVIAQFVQRPTGAPVSSLSEQVSISRNTEEEFRESIQRAALNQEGGSQIGMLHEHPHMQWEKNIPSDHVIVDKADWIEARGGISSEQI